MYRPVYALNGFLAALLTLTGANAYCELVEQWGGKGLSVQVYSDNRAFLTFDCAKGESAEWPAGKYPFEAKGKVQSKLWVIPNPPEVSALFSVSLVSSDEMVVTLRTPEKAALRYVLRKNETADFHDCFLPL